MRVEPHTRAKTRADKQAHDNKLRPKGAIPLYQAKLKQMVSVEGMFDFTLTPDPVVAGHEHGQAGGGLFLLRNSSEDEDRSREYVLRTSAFVDMKGWLEALRQAARQESHGSKTLGHSPAGGKPRRR